ncbi:MAG: GDP-mannose 4,6-dehydratase [Candidatus Micrarchaeota archaeon]|nr:GDP-mannose 4,6-dehydratase [Candidatus Micrarchaeota archaeon]
MAKTSSFWNGRQVLLTGASGLVGSWLVEELLSQGAQPVCLVRDRVPDSRFFSEGFDKKVTVAAGELEDRNAIERVINEYEPATIFHLGAQTIVQTANRSPLHTFRANIEGTWNLLEACRTHGKAVEQIIVASSDKAYGDQKVLPYTEDTPLQGRHPYDVSKSCVDLISQSYAATYSLPVAISRCGNFFGGGDLNFNRIVPGTIQSLCKNEAPVIRTDGKYVRDYIYVKDAVSAYLTLAEKYKPALCGEAFNFSNEAQMTTLEMVSLISKLMKKSIAPKVQNSASGEIRNQHLSAKKAREVLGWKAKYGIEEGLAETIDWYLAYFGKKRIG